MNKIVTSLFEYKGTNSFFASLLGYLNATVATGVVVVGTIYGYYSEHFLASLVLSTISSTVLFGVVAIAVDTRESIRGILDIQREAAARHKTTADLLRGVIAAIETNALVVQKALHAEQVGASNPGQREVGGVTATATSSELTAGDIVTHRTFGRGVVISVNAAAGTAVVRFSNNNDVVREIHTLSR
jgi:hypothetical protein